MLTIGSNLSLALKDTMQSASNDIAAATAALARLTVTGHGMRQSADPGL